MPATSAAPSARSRWSSTNHAERPPRLASAAAARRLLTGEPLRTATCRHHALSLTTGGLSCAQCRLIAAPSRQRGSSALYRKGRYVCSACHQASLQASSSRAPSRLATPLSRPRGQGCAPGRKAFSLGERMRQPGRAHCDCEHPQSPRSTARGTRLLSAGTRRVPGESGGRIPRAAARESLTLSTRGPRSAAGSYSPRPYGWPELARCGATRRPIQPCGTSIGMRTSADIAGWWSNWLKNSGRAAKQNPVPKSRNLILRRDSPCRSGIYIDRAPGSWALVALLSMATAGALIGRSIILHAPDAARFVQDNKPALQLWAGLIGFLCGYGLAAGAVMTFWLWQLQKIFQPRVPRMSAFRWALAAALGWPDLLPAAAPA